MGQPWLRLSIDTTTGGPAEGFEPYFQLEDNGAFASPVMEDKKVVGWRSRHPHITTQLLDGRRQRIYLRGPAGR